MPLTSLRRKGPQKAQEPWSSAAHARWLPPLWNLPESGRDFYPVGACPRRCRASGVAAYDAPSPLVQSTCPAHDVCSAYSVLVPDLLPAALGWHQRSDAAAQSQSCSQPWPSGRFFTQRVVARSLCHASQGMPQPHCSCDCGLFDG